MSLFSFSNSTEKLSGDNLPFSMFLSKKGIRLVGDMPVCLPDCVVHASSEYYQRISKRDYICRLANFLQICPPREKLCFDKPCGAGWNRFKGCWGLPSGAEESTHGTVPGRPSECRHFVLSEDSNDSSVHGTSKGAGSAAPGIIRTFCCSSILATQFWDHLASKQMSFMTTFENVD